MYKISFLSVCLLFCCLLFSCRNNTSTQHLIHQEKEDSLILLHRLQQCSKLYSSEFIMRKFVIEKSSQSIEGEFMNHKINVSVPSRSRRIAIPVNIIIKGYIDMAQLQDKNIMVSGDRISITLPDPCFSITSVQIDRENIVQDADILRSDYHEEKIIQLVNGMVKRLDKEIPRNKFLETARSNAAYTLFPLLQQLGFKDIQIKYRTELLNSSEPLPLLLDKER